MKQKITKQELARLNKMNPGAFYIEKQSLFDRICYFINGGKSIVTAELKPFV